MAKVRGRSIGDDSIGIFNFMELESHINSRGRKTRHEELPDSEIDHLSLMAREAKRHGYGCHYGNYIADYHPVRKPKILTDEEFLQEDGSKICPMCGARFISFRKDRLYCSDACRFAAQKVRDALGLNTGRHTRPIKATFVESGSIAHYPTFNSACAGTGVGRTLVKSSLDTGRIVKGYLFEDDEEERSE